MTATVLEMDSVRSALDAMRQAEPLDNTHPLIHFLSLRRAESTGRADSAIFNRLAHIIQHRLNTQRALYALSPVTIHADRAAARSAIYEDFCRHNEELEAWSYLYYRYIRYDLDLAVEDLESLTMQDRRTLQRRQSRAIARLTHVLTRREDHVRTRDRQTVQRSRLPRQYPLSLFGRDTLIATLFARLAGTDQPRHVLIYGAPGVGKSAVALAVSHLLIERLSLANVAWIDQPESRRVEEQITNGLNLPRFLDHLNLADPHTELSHYVQVKDTLVVLDHADVLLEDRRAFQSLVQALGTARLIVCAQNMPDWVIMPKVQVGELDQASVLDLMARLAREGHYHDPNDVDHFSRQYDELGGNPQALRLALAMGRRYKVERIDLYRAAWDNLPEAARLLWLLLAMSPVYGYDQDRLCKVIPDVRADTIFEAVDSLDRASVLVRDSDGTTISLPKLGRAFAEGQLQVRTDDDIQMRQLVQKAARYLTTYLTQQPDREGCLRLLTCVQQAELSPAFQLELAYTFAPLMESSGTWMAWANYLEPLQAALPGKDGLWVGLRLAEALRWLARWQEAGYLLAEVIEKAGTSGDFDLQANAMLEMAAISRQQKHFETARAWLFRARDHYSRVRLNLHTITAELIQIALDVGDLQQARDYLADLDEIESSSRLLHLAAQIALASDEAEVALNYARRAQKQLTADLPRLARTSALLGQIYQRLGNRHAAIDHLVGALSIMEQTHDVLGHARVRLNLAALYLGSGNVPRAMFYLRDLPGEFASLGDVDSLQATARNLEILNSLAQRKNLPEA